MKSNDDNSDIKTFYQSLQSDLKAIQISMEEGGNLEQIFTQIAIDFITEAGESENVRVAYDEKALGTRNQHKINAYSISDNYETLDLFISIYKGTDEISKVAKDEIDTAAKRISNFLKKGVDKEYVNDIDESSQIFDFAHTLYKSQDIKDTLVRINAIILTDCSYTGDFPSSVIIADFPIYFRVVDIGYLFNISEKSHIPIEIDFEEAGYEVPCLKSPSENDQYQSYLAILPGKLLAAIYERFGSRLLEQNVRSFLQFTGKINKGIRNTILKESHMFLAFNNGIAATAEELKINLAKNREGYYIKSIKDLQIVNGGQTTASIFHTLKKDKADISGIFVQLKLTVVKDRTNFSQIVSRISEYANTQNKVSISDLSANNPVFIELEKFSRLIFAPHVAGSSGQTRWFFERARGQYKNERNREKGARLRVFDIQNPRKQLFTKEDLAKYINAFSEVIKSNKTLIGPHVVVKGNQINHKAFIDYNLTSEIDNIYFENTIAKSILFRTAEKVYGVKPNAIGDLRFVTVPYTLSYLSFKIKINLYKIWKEQIISEPMQSLLKNLMIKVEDFIKTQAPSSLYVEWAKKEECWNALKSSGIVFDIAQVEDYIEDPKSSLLRKKMNKAQIDFMEEEYQFERINFIPIKIWKLIKDWAAETAFLNLSQLDRIHNYILKKGNNIPITNEEGLSLIEILDYVTKKNPDLLKIENLTEDFKTEDVILIEKATKMIEWIKSKKHKMESEHFSYLKDIQHGKIGFSIESKSTISALEKYLGQYEYQK